ncbi:MAG TPA: TRAP transporter small permease subunit [Xanthobacteraceae bacterium]|nr:TRAP transporter small permease subunit [Xanthobacteraceae bacterium]
MVDRLAAIAAGIDRFNAAIGRTVTWCLIGMVIVQVAVVLMRYVLGIGSIWLSETILYAHATLFMGAAAWTLQARGHVRVDIFYADAAPRTRALVDLAGALFLLLPFIGGLAWFALPYVTRSWAILEHSPEASGLPLVFLLKTLILLFALLLGLQGIAQAARAWLTLVGAAPAPAPRPHH